MEARDSRPARPSLTLLWLDILHSFVPLGPHPRNAACPLCREPLGGRGLSCERCLLGMHDRCYVTRVAGGGELRWLTRRDDLAAGRERIFLCCICRV